MFEEIGETLVEAGLVRTSALLPRSDVSIALGHAALRWDRVLSTLQSRSGAIGLKRGWTARRRTCCCAAATSG